MSEHPRHDPHAWDSLSPDEVLAALVYELYTPVSLLSSDLNRLTGDEDELTEEEADTIFEQMLSAVNQLSKTVVHLKLYTQERAANRAKE